MKNTVNTICLRKRQILASSLRANISALPIKGRSLGFLLFLCIILSVPWPAHVGAAASRPLRIAYLSTSATMASLWMAKETGAIAKEGLDAEILSMTSSVAMPALIASEVDAVEVSAAPVLTASLRGYDVVFVAGLLNTMIWSFYGRPEIKNVEQLKGKVIGTDRPATPVAYGTLVALKKMGLVTQRCPTLRYR